jgi:hypothetical protein
MIAGKICREVRQQGDASVPTPIINRTRPYVRIIYLQAGSSQLSACKFLARQVRSLMM